MQWEYKVIQYLEDYKDQERPKGVSYVEHTENILNQLGKLGWELVGWESAWIFKKRNDSYEGEYFV